MRNQYMRLFWGIVLVLWALPLCSQGQARRTVPGAASSPRAALYSPAVSNFSAQGVPRPPLPRVSRARQVEAAEEAAVKARVPKKSPASEMRSVGALGNVNYQHTSAEAKRDRLFNAPGRVNPAPKAGAAFVPKDKAGRGIMFPVHTQPAPSILVPASAPVTYTAVGDTVFSSEGPSYTRVGDTVFSSDGTSYTRVGDTTFGTDGTSYTRVGDTTFGTDGTSYTRVGDTTFGTDGSSATQIGSTVFPVGPTPVPPEILFP